MPIFALPIPSSLRPSPLDKGSRPPGPPFYGGPNQADLAVIAKARVAQLIAFPSSFAAAHWAGDEGITLPWLKAPLFAVGLKCGSGGRRIQEPLYFFSQGPMRASGRSQAARCAAPTTSET